MPNERRYSNELNLESVGINLPYNMHKTGRGSPISSKGMTP